MKKWFTLSVCSVFVVCALTSSLAVAKGLKFTREESKVLDAKAAKSIHIINDAGGIDISPSKDKMVSIKVLYKATDQQALDDYALETSLEGSKLVVNVKTPKPRAKPGSNWNAHLTISIPQDVKLDISSDAGKVTVNDFHGELSANIDAARFVGNRLSLKGNNVITVDAGHLELLNLTVSNGTKIDLSGDAASIVVTGIDMSVWSNANVNIEADAGRINIDKKFNGIFNVRSGVAEESLAKVVKAPVLIFSASVDAGTISLE